jgi:hypothetical protein
MMVGIVSSRGKLQANNPFCTADYRPDRRNLDHQHDDGGQQANRQQEPILLEIGQRDYADRQSRYHTAKRDRKENQTRTEKGHGDADMTM